MQPGEGPVVGLDDEPVIFEDEGIWYKFRCPDCDQIVEFESDVRGEKIECDNCGTEGEAAK